MSTCVKQFYYVLCVISAMTTAITALAAEEVLTPYGPVSLPFQLHKVADAPVYYVIGLSGVPDAENEGHTSNAGFVVTDDGVVVFDALGTPALGYRLLQRIREVTEQPIAHIVVSHYHADHIYGLQAFKQHAGDPPVWAQSLALPVRARTHSDALRNAVKHCFHGWMSTRISCRRIIPSRMN